MKRLFFFSLSWQSVFHVHAHRSMVLSSTNKRTCVCIKYFLNSFFHITFKFILRELSSIKLFIYFGTCNISYTYIHMSPCVRIKNRLDLTSQDRERHANNKHRKKHDKKKEDREFSAPGEGQRE